MSFSLYPYFYYPPYFAPLHRLAILSILLIPSSLASQMRWCGPGLAILFPFNLCPSSSSSRHLIHTLRELERLDGWSPSHPLPTLPEAPCHLEHIITAQMNVKTGGICVHVQHRHAQNNNDVLASLTRTRSLSQQRLSHKLACLSCHKCSTSCQGTRWFDA